jgi:hypothetical protein
MIIIMETLSRRYSRYDEIFNLNYFLALRKTDVYIFKNCPSVWNKAVSYIPCRSPAALKDNSHIPCRSPAANLPRLSRGLERSLSERHIRGMTGERHGKGMTCVNQPRPHCVNQMEMKQSKPLSERHGRGMACERHDMCESGLRFP